MSKKLTIRNLAAGDCSTIAESFNAQGWSKPKEQFDGYLADQNKGKREVLIAEMNGVFTGYLTIIWESCYKPFKKDKIPEIVDFNVLIKFQGKGIGSKCQGQRRSKDPIRDCQIKIFVYKYKIIMYCLDGEDLKRTV